MQPRRLSPVAVAIWAFLVVWLVACKSERPDNVSLDAPPMEPPELRPIGLDGVEINKIDFPQQLDLPSTAESLERLKARLREITAASNDHGAYFPSSANRRKEPGFFWNAHAVNGAGNQHAGVVPGNQSGSAMPERLVPVLEQGKQYTIHVSLRGFIDRTEGAMGTEASDLTNAVIENALFDEKRTIKLRPLVVVDSQYFDRPDVPDSFYVHFDAIREFAQAGSGSEMAEDGFAQFEFDIQTRKAKRGLGTIAISFWDGMRPVDEVVLQFCVDDGKGAVRPCNRHEASRAGSPGAFMVATLDQPDLVAAIHLVNTEELGVIGFMRTSRNIEGLSWRVAESDEQLRLKLQSFQKTTFTRPADVAGVSNALFALAAREPDAATARTALNALLADLADEGPPFSGEDHRPVIKFRYVSWQGQQQPLIYPAANLEIPGMPDERAGHRLRVQSNLPVDDPLPQIGCIADWIPFVDPAPTDGALKAANLRLTDRIFAGDGNDRPPVFAFWPGLIVPVATTIDGPGSPMASRIQDSGAEGEQDPVSSAVLMQGHYGDGGFSYVGTIRDDVPTPVLTATDFDTLFGRPSFAFLAMCSSADYGQNSLVEELNRRGVESIVLTTKPVRGEVAGAMVGCFLDAIASEPEPEISVGAAFARAEACMYRNHFPLEVFSFALAGDPDVKLCTPNHSAGGSK